MTENKAKMGSTDTQLEFFNFDALSDDEVQKIKSFLKQPCAAVELPDLTHSTVNDVGNATMDYKNEPVMIPMEYTTALTIGENYTTHITQPQLYTVATTVNGGSYIQAGYPLAGSVYLSKDYLVPKIINGMEAVEQTAVTAAVAPCGDAVLDTGGLAACIANPAAGVVVSSSLYAAATPWNGMYQCTQYVLPHPIPAFLTPIAPVHPTGLRPAIPSAPVSVRGDTPASQAMTTPYMAMATIPASQVAPPPTAMTVSAPSTLIPVPPPQGVIVPSMIAEEASIPCTADPTQVVSIAPMPITSEIEFNVGEHNTVDHVERYESGEIETGYDPECVCDEMSVVDEDKPQNDDRAGADPKQLENSHCESLEEMGEGDEVVQSLPVEQSVTSSSAWNITKSWASLFKNDAALPSTNIKSQSAAQPIDSTLTSNVVPQTCPVIVNVVEASVVSPDTNKPQLVNSSQSQLSNGVTESNYDDIYRLGEILRDVQLDNRHSYFLPRGLSNKGNWCYINATLQALLACPPFYNLLSKLPVISGLKHGQSSTPITDSMVEFIHEFEPVSIHKLQGMSSVMRKKEDIANTGPPFEPVYIYDMLSRLKLNAFEGRQEDAEEFLSCLLNGLHDEMLAAISNVEGSLNNGLVATNGELENQEDDGLEDESWKVIEKRNKYSVTRTTDFSSSPVSDIFCGRIRSALHAVSTSSATLQPFFTLQLDIQSENVRSVKEALQCLVIKETLQGYHCSKTKQEVAASRQITLEELPPILILHLKRFVYDKDGGSQKLSKKVDFTTDLEFNKELLSTTAKTKIAPKQRNYKLIGVVYHCGNEAAKGHYVADVYHHGSNTWIRADDARITTLIEVKVLNHPANMVPYLLFYRRLDTIQMLASLKK